MARVKNGMDQERQKRLKELVREMRELLPKGSFAEREQAMLDLVSEIEKDLTQQELQELANEVPDEVKVDGKTYKRHQLGTVQYYTLAGPVTVLRDTYREVGVRNGPTVVPLELLAGLAERATPALARNVAHGYALHDMRTHGELLRKAHCVPPARATLERMAKALARDVSEDISRVEKLAFEHQNVPAAACAVTVGLDRTSVPMAELLPSGVTTEPRRRTRPYVREQPPAMSVNWRMAYVGTVCLVDEHGEAIQTYRYAATAADDPKSLICRMGWMVESILRQQPYLRVGIMQDGAPEMWNLMRQMLQPLREQSLLDNWMEGIDMPHLLGRLSQASELVGMGPAVLKLWKRDLLASDSKIDVIDAVLRRRLHKLTEKQRLSLEEHLTYIQNNKDRMRYATLRKAGLPVGSGVTESTAKNVVNMRAKRSGQRWSVEGLRGVLNLRALLKSDGLSRFWEVFSKRYAPPVVLLAAAA